MGDCYVRWFTWYWLHRDRQVKQAREILLACFWISTPCIYFFLFFSSLSSFLFPLSSGPSSHAHGRYYKTPSHKDSIPAPVSRRRVSDPVAEFPFSAHVSPASVIRIYIYYPSLISHYGGVRPAPYPRSPSFPLRHSLVLSSSSLHVLVCSFGRSGLDLDLDLIGVDWS